MANSYFQFKQFTIHQDKSAMKVCTDACIFGALVAERIAQLEPGFDKKNYHILDIGTGTGLLSLMAAQKTKALIDAVETDHDSYLQAKENFMRSPWFDRLNITHADIVNYKPNNKYEYIISNPPFFENDLRSPSQKKNKSKHSDLLTLQQLLKAISNNLNDEGVFFVLLPFHRVEYFKDEAVQHGYSPVEEILINQTPAHEFFRGILAFSKGESNTQTTKLLIKEKDGNYSEEFIKLLKDYYLSL